VILEPVFVVGAPRSGVRLVYESLIDCRGVYSRADPVGDPLAEIPLLAPSQRNWDSDYLATAAPELLERCRANFEINLRDRDDNLPEDNSGQGVAPSLEFALTNALRVPLLRQVFPRARFIVVEREAPAAVSSLIEAWGSGRFVTHRDLPDWSGRPWSFPLIEGWRDLVGLDLVTTAQRQWTFIADRLTADVVPLPPNDVVFVSFEAFLTEPSREVQRIADELGWVVDRPLARSLPLTKSTISSPARDKWKTVHPDLTVRADPDRSDSPPTASATDHVASPDAPTGGGGAQANLFESSYTTSVLELLAASSSSLLVSTYQSGRLISLREEDGQLNTHFVLFDAPMGISCDSSMLVVASNRQIHEHRNHEGAALNIAPPGSHDACYLPRNVHVTGAMDVHEIVLANDGLWAVSTRFSCLATLDAINSMVPRWKPKFVSQLTAEDRCHLNGLAVRNGKVRYVTALGQTDEAAGWRQGKGTSGVVIDVANGSLIAEGLAMPHSPRFYDGSLWVLESGKGTLARVDTTTGEVETVATLPGFTRGLAFTGRIAWVGLSQVRESVFRGLPVTSQADRACGVWAVDIDTGVIVGWIRFEGIVQEIFDVQICPWRHPGITDLGDTLVAQSFVFP